MECSGRTQPSAPGLRRRLAPAHRLRPRESLHHIGHDLADHLDRRPALLLDHRDVEVALLVRLHLGLLDRREPRRLEEALDRAFVRADARALALLLHVRLVRRHALHREREPPRRRECLGALIDEAGRDQLVGDELAQILGGARLHARGDFLGEQFDQEVGHGGYLAGLPAGTSHRRACHARPVTGSAAALPRARQLFAGSCSIWTLTAKPANRSLRANSDRNVVGDLLGRERVGGSERHQDRPTAVVRHHVIRELRHDSILVWFMTAM